MKRDRTGAVAAAAGDDAPARGTAADVVWCFWKIEQRGFRFLLGQAVPEYQMESLVSPELFTRQRERRRTSSSVRLRG
jgi:hypothetical protein